MNIQVEVELSPAFKARLGFEHLTMALEQGGATVKGLLAALAEKEGERIRPLLFEGEGILPGLMVMVNEKIFTAAAIEAKDVPLKEGDAVSLLYFLSGG